LLFLSSFTKQWIPKIFPDGVPPPWVPKQEMKKSLNRLTVPEGVTRDFEAIGRYVDSVWDAADGREKLLALFGLTDDDSVLQVRAGGVHAGGVRAGGVHAGGATHWH
jgi:mannose/fructose/N-acetylgalactosamine-specific phosphotransferase system component IIB